MGFLKKITRPISRVLDKIVPNEIKPALPFLAAAAPFMAPGIMGAFGNSMLSRGLISGGLNLGSQLAQEGSDGDFSGLSTLMAAATGALSTPRTTTTMSPKGQDLFKVEQGGAADFFKNKAAGMEPGFAKSGLGALEKSSNYLTGVGDTLQNNLFSKEGLKAALVPVGQGFTDLAVAENRRALKDYERDMADYEAGMDEENSNRAFAIRQSMEAYGFTEQEILDAIEAAGYRAGGRVGFDNGGSPSSLKEAALNTILHRFGGKYDRPTSSGDSLEDKITEAQLADVLKYDFQGPSGVMGLEESLDMITPESVSRSAMKMQRDGDPDFSGIKGAVESVDENLRVDRAGDFFRLREEAIQKGDSDKIKEIESDFFREFGMVMPQMAKDGGLMNLGGKEMDMRGGGFIPIGKKERADDVPARLSKNEFVMTADAVRAAGGGSVNEGAKRMYETMNKLEARA